MISTGWLTIIFLVKFVEFEVQETNAENLSLALHGNIHVKISKTVTQQENVRSGTNRMEIRTLVVHNRCVLVERVD